MPRPQAIIIIVSSISVFAGVLFVHQLSANHAPGASVTQVNHSVHTLSSFLRIRADPSMQIFWISVTAALSDIFLMFSTIPLFTVPSAPTTTGITKVFICHTFCIKVLGLCTWFSFRFPSVRCFSIWWDSHINLLTGGIHWSFNDNVCSVRCYSSISIDWHVPRDGDVVVFIVYHSLRIVFVPFVCNLDIMIFTDDPMEICCSIIVPGDVLCFG